MRDVRWMKVLRDLGLHWGRSLLVVLAIATGLAGAGTILVKFALVSRATETDFLASNPPAARLFVDRVTPEALHRVREVEGVDTVEARRTLAGSIWIDGERDAATIVAAPDLEHLGIGRIGLKAGRWPGDGEVAIERSSLRRTPVETGAEIALAVSSTEPTRFPVTGIVHDVGVAPAWMEQQIYVYTTPATLARLAGSSDLDEIRFTVDASDLHRAGVRAIAERARAEIEGLGLTVRDLRVPPPGEHVHAGQMNALFFVQAALGLLALLFSGTLVFNLMTAILVGQRREIGMMKAIGARNGQIATLYLAMVGLLGALASLLAAPVASVAGRAYASLTLLALNFEPSEVRIPLWTLLLPAATGVALALAAAAVPVLTGVRLTVAEALRDHEIDELEVHGGDGRRVLSRLGLSRPLLLSLRNTLRRRVRLALTVGTLAIGGALFMGTLHLRASIRQQVDGWFAGSEDDIAVRLAKEFPADELVPFVEQIPGVATAEAQGTVVATIVHSDGSAGPPFPLVARTPDSAFVGPRLTAGRWLRAGGSDGAVDASGELVVNRAWTTRLQPADVGDVVTLRVGSRERTWTIVGVIDSSPLATVGFTTWSDLSRLGDGRREAGSLLVRLDPTDRGLVSHIEMVRARDGGAEPSFIDRIHGMGPDPGAGLDDPATVLAEAPRLFEVILENGGYPVASVQSLRSVRQGLVDHMLLVVDLLGVMALLVIAVGGFGLATTTSLGVLERTREIGILRAIGAGHPAIRRIVVSEAIAVATAAWALAVPLAVPMSYGLGSVFGRIMLQMPIRLAGAPLAALLWLLLSLLLAWLASLGPAIRATRLTPREALARS